jgi:formylglycine-generating enzyme
VNLVFLDCCRDDLGKSVGGAEMSPLRARGSFIGFATRSGDSDDPEEHGSPYTRFLLQHLDKPGVSVADMYGYVIRDVKDYTKKKLGEERRPGFYSELEGDPFYFVPVKLTTPAMTDAEIERRAEEKARELAARMVPSGNGPSPIGNSPSPKDDGTSFASPLDQVGIGKGFQTKLPGDVPLLFRYCPPGSFTMGSPASETGRSDDENQVQVRISQGFWMGQTEVTQAQWKALMGTSPAQQNASGDVNGLGADHPMYFISWNDAQAFIQKLNNSQPLPAGWQYALPTEAEWEYACRAGTESAFHFGDVLNGKQANMDGNYPYGTTTKGTFLGKTCPVASYPANAWGLHDMHGNVWEWCADWYAEKLVGGTNPPGASSGSRRVYRGGSWNGLGRDCRSAYRVRLAPGNRDSLLGFRLAAVPAGAR